MTESRVERPGFVLLVAGLGFFLLSFVAMGIAPWTTLRHVMKPPPGFVNPYRDDTGVLTAAGRGREVYIREGCWHCHSQFVRPIGGEEFRYGPVSEAWESMFDVPQLYGTRRIGPDLAREAGRRPDDWQFAHLYNPRATVPMSVMPAYTWLFDEWKGSVTPKQEALDLVAYLNTLGGRFESEIRDLANPRAIRVSGAPDPTEASMARGKLLFEENCSGCHGALGDGTGLAKPPLSPSAVDLTRRYLTGDEIFATLYSGIKGSAMPSFREMPEKDLWALAGFVAKKGERVRAILDAERETATLAGGHAIYTERCLVCHGAEGMGDGVGGKALTPSPWNLAGRLYPPSVFASVMREGRPGTAMTSFPMLADTEISLLHMYVTDLFARRER